MLTLSTEQLISQLQLQTNLIHRHLDDLSDDEACVAPAGGNSANWIAGHLLVFRDRICELLGAERQLDAALHDRYGNGSAAITAPAADLPTLKQLRAMLDEQLPHLLDCVRSATDTTFAQEMTRPNGTVTTLGARFSFYALFHEPFHIGQFEYARHAVGKHEGVI
ncbi:MAG: DinB family protein [Caldilineaceae bacterium]